MNGAGAPLIACDRRSFLVQLDGFIDNPHLWSMQYSDEKARAFMLRMTLAADALLLGRVTYEVWPRPGRR